MNCKIKNEDFYDADNIFVLSNRDMNELSDFIKSQYKELPADIVYKYSFENCIHYVLDQNPSFKIELP